MTSIPSDSVPFPGATPRPWRKCGGYTAKFIAICSDEANQYVVFEMANPYEDGIESRECPNDETQQANAALIVEAVNSYDALKAEVQRLREAGEAAKEAIQKLTSIALFTNSFKASADIRVIAESTIHKLTAALRVP